MPSVLPVGRPDYGIDAPGVIRNLLVVGVGLLVVALFWPSLFTFVVGPVRFELLSGAIGTGVSCSIGGVLMLVYAKWGKFVHRDRMLALHAWQGNEYVLDVGTGRGLLMIGAAKHLSSGRATGIDIWRKQDLSGNNDHAARLNIVAEGVDDRCTLRSMPAQQMDFGANQFNVVLSNLCLHNISRREDRLLACGEVVRVLRPGGVAIISDFRHTAEYASAFKLYGCDVVFAERDAWSWLTTFPPLRIVVATKSITDDPLDQLVAVPADTMRPSATAAPVDRG